MFFSAYRGSGSRKLIFSGFSVNFFWMGGGFPFPSLDPPLTEGAIKEHEILQKRRLNSRIFSHSNFQWNFWVLVINVRLSHGLSPFLKNFSVSYTEIKLLYSYYKFQVN